MKAVVFGGSGFLGSHISDVLSDAGYKVTIFDLKPSQYLREGQEMITGNILDEEAVSDAILGADFVYHLAGVADLDDASTKPAETVKQNILGTNILLEASRRLGIKRFMYASTIYVYSDKGGFYRCSKQASELYIEEFHRHYGLDFTILRYGSLYGLRADKRNSIYNYLYQALNKKKVVIFGSGKELREYIHVLDAAKLSVKALGEEFKNKHLIIAGHYPMRSEQLIAMIREILNDSFDVQYEKGTDPHHYTITPYSYIPKVGLKLTTDCCYDMGQGLLECLSEINKELARDSKQL